MDKSFEVKVFFDTIYMNPNDICQDICGIHSLKPSHILLHMNKKCLGNQQHLSFFHSNMPLNVFFCRDDTLHDGSFSNICASGNSIFFNTFYRTEISVFIHYNEPFSNIFHISIWLIFLHAHRVYIFLYGSAEDTDVYRMVLFSFRKFDRMNEDRYLFHIQVL